MMCSADRVQVRAIYERLPRTDCARCLDCCRVCPPVALAELGILDGIVLAKPYAGLLRFCEEVIRYELLGRLTKTGACPFLIDSNCSIYEDRPLACRQFALTSRKYYDEVLRRNLARRQISYPNDILRPTLQDQHPPAYCTDIWSITGDAILRDDPLIIHLYGEMGNLGAAGRPISHDLFHISYSLGLLIRIWGAGETEKRLHFLASIFETEGSVSAESVCHQWALELCGRVKS